MTERYVRDHGVYTNWAEIAATSPTYVHALARGRATTRRCSARRISTVTSCTPSTHVDDLAWRLSDLGFAEVRESGDKFSRSDAEPLHRHLRDRGLLDAYRQHIADRSYQGENESGQNATKRVPMWDATPMPIPLDAYIDFWHGEEAVRWVERVRPRRTVLHVSRLPRPA